MRRLVLIVALIITAGQGLPAQSAGKLKLDAYGYLWAGNYPAALEAFNKLIGSTSSPHPEYMLERGKIRYLQEEGEGALADLTVAEMAGMAGASLWKARIYAADNNVVMAVNSLSSYLRSDPAVDRAGIQKDPVFKELHQSEEWLQLWQDMPEDRNLEILQTAEYYLSRKDYAKAHRAIDDNLHSGNDDAKLYAMNGRIFCREGNLPLALNEVNHALSLDPESKQLLLQKAEYLSMLESYEEAFELLDELVEEHQTDFDSRLRRARLALKTHHIDRAMEDMDLILRYSDEPDHLFLGGQIAYADGNYISALKTFNTLLRQDSTNAAYLKARGMTYYHTRTYKQSAYDLSMSLDLDPSDPETNYYKGLAEHALGRESMACYYMERAIKENYAPAVKFSEKHCSAR